MNITLEEILSSKNENEILEFKEAKNSFDPNKLGCYFSALSNEANLMNKPYALFILGINDKKEVVGSNISDSEINKYKLEISKNTSPTMNFEEVLRINDFNNQIIVFKIPSAPKGMPVAWKNHYYGRDGESLGGLQISEIERIRNQQMNNDWSAQTIENASIKDLSEEAILHARKQFVAKNPKLVDDVNQWDDLTFLSKAKLLINKKITRTAILLLGKPESEHFITPSVAKITWILKDKDGIEKDYEHFSCPFILSINEVYSKIRNIKYRYIQDGSLFPEEVLQYDPFTIREALNNCIAHQDYTLCGKINLVENEDGILIFKNAGDFIPKSVEDVINADAPESLYRNPFLANAMVNLNMIDTIGSGIKKLFLIQSKKYFPLPDYEFANRTVQVTINGKVLDMNYARKLAMIKNLSLKEIILLDKVQKKKKLSDDEIKTLKEKKLIEGRKPNIYISSSIAAKTSSQSEYMKLKGIDDDYCKKIILDYLREFKSAKKSDLEEVLLLKLPDSLTSIQKQNKIKNILQKLKRDEQIKLNPASKLREWILV